MLNMKKGLAIVLAAATALTFAPVANLGNAVQAEAATAQFTTENVTSVSLVVSEAKTLVVNDSLSTDRPVQVHIDDKSIACLAKGKSEGAGMTADTAVDTIDDISNEAENTTADDTAKTHSFVVYARSEGSTTLHLFQKDANGEVSAEQTIAIKVSKLEPTISAAKSKVTATKVDSGDPKSDTSASNTYEELNLSYTNYTVGAGKKVVTEAKSGSDSVATVDMTQTDIAAATAFSSVSGNKIKINFKGVGETSVVVTAYLEDAADGGHKTALCSTTIDVVVSNAVDTLHVSYDSNQTGKADETKATAAVNTQEATFANLYDTTTKTTAVAAASTNAGHVATNAAGDEYTSTKIADASYAWVLTKKAVVTGPELYLDNKGNSTAKISASDDLGRAVSYCSGSNRIAVDNNGNVTLLDTSLDQVAQDHTTYIDVSVPMTGSGNKIISSLTVRIPVTISNKETTYITVKKSNGETIAKTVGKTNISSSTTIDDLNTIYLSTDDKKSDTLTIESNTDAAYISGAVYTGISNGDNNNIQSDVVSYSNGTITANKTGTAVVELTARNSSNTYQNSHVFFKVEVVTKKANNKITVDPSTISLTAANKTATISAKSTYKTTFKYELVKAVGSTETATSSDVDVNPATGALTYKSTNAGTVYVRVSGSATNEAIAPDAAYVTVNYSSSKVASPLAVKESELKLKAGDTAKIDVVASGSAVVTYKSSNDSVAVVDANGTVTAKAIGSAFITVSEAADDKYEAGTQIVTVLVSESGKEASKLGVTTKALNLTEGESDSIVATGTALSYKSSDETVATVDETGKVTAVKAGVAVITVTDAGNDKFAGGTKDINVSVKAAPVTYKNPAKVTGVKIKNAKGAKVTITFKKDKTNPNMKYYVQKQTQKKKSGKSVGSNKTTLSVKSGKSVKVRVKAYYYDANGVKHVGKYSAWTSIFKTDKK